MWRRRRRRSAFAKQTPPQVGYALAAAGVAVVIGGFIFFMHQADVLKPPQSEVRVELPDAFKQ
jgi:hypothetical protein